MAATAHQPALKARSNTMPLGTACAGHQSSRLGQQSPRQGKWMTLGDVGAFLSRPSPRHGSRTSPQTGWTQVLGTRGGVVRNKDGFEVFYGVDKTERPAKPHQSKVHERDGFDVFFGIHSQDRANRVRQAPMQMSARGNVSSSAAELKVQQQQVESQLQARLANPVVSQDQTSRFVPVGRSVSDSVMLHYACGYEPADPTMAQVANEDVSSIPPVREEEGDEEETKEPVACANLSHELSAPAMVPKLSQPSALSRQAQLVKDLEVFSMCGRHKPGLIPAGVVAFDLATPTPSFEPSSAHGPAVKSA
eukprot:CAMPEP_0172656524 /NCGR_PEP_ID=MMETSP1074-20121228/1427_1 /TAXON_ID=2916 /ORGANISM="Ceratium fusus, Strain PA161109" /LENGTH=305 /DNA_ID=CAMNT_0013471381 /DNA_START=75 /DNA_END=992 /DNA_ORIENTATION=+